MNLEIYGIRVSVSGPSGTIDKLEKDFSYFVSENNADADFNIILYDSCDPGFVKFHSNIIPSFIHPEFRLYKSGSSRFVDYKGGAYSLYSKGSNKISFYSGDENMLHELSYLAILSVAGSRLEKSGRFRMHAMALDLSDTAFIFLASSGTGKSTLMLDVMLAESACFFSDEIVLIDGNAVLYPFPVRIGMADPDAFDNIPEVYVYELERRKYGRKILLDTKYFTSRIARPGKCKNIIVLKRPNSDECRLHRSVKLRAVPAMFINFIAGFGLPQLIEYLEHDFRLKDIIMMLATLYRRLIVMFSVLNDSSVKVYVMELGKNRASNVRNIANLAKGAL